MSVLTITINDLAAAVLPALWRASWQGGLALLLVFVLCRAVRRIPAQVQCWLWRLAYLKLLIAGVWIVPVELRWLPPQQPTAEATPAIDVVEPSAPLFDSPIAESPVDEAVVTPPLRDPVVPPASTAEVVPRLSGLGWLLIAWLAGVTFQLGNLTRHGIRVRRLLSRLTPVTGGALAGRLSEHCRQMRVGRPPEVRVVADVRSPFLVGVLRPVIVLPSAVIESCTTDEIDAVLIHELAHIRRRDLLWNWLPALAETAFFFHPLLWLTRREWRLAQEIATDELAVSASRVDVADYAMSLIALVSKSPDAAMSPHLAVALSEAYTQLARRMKAMQTFQPLTVRRRVSIAAAVLTLAGAGLVPWKLTAQELQKKPAAADASAAVDAAAVAQSVPESEDSEPPQVQTRPITVTGRALDSDGHPIAGATMYLSSQAVDWKRLAETVTDKTGRYEFRDVPLPLETSNPFGGWTSGKFEVFGIAVGYGFGWRPSKWYFPERYPSIANSNWEEEDPPERFYADEPIELDVTFGPAAKLGGRIVDDTGQPIPGASVAIRYCDPELGVNGWSSLRGGTEFDSLNEREIVPPDVKLRRTDADGGFEFTNLPADCRFRIDVRPPGFPSRWIWAVTRDDFPSEAAGKPVYGDGMVVEFVRPEEVALRIAYGDIGTPADHVLVSASNPQGSSGAVSDHEGRVSLRLSPGEYAVELLPRIGTPYLVTNLSLTVPVEQSASPVELRLHSAAVVEVTVVDESTGVGIADVDFWSCDGPALQGLIDRRELHYFRSYEAPIRICHVERPRTDADGKLRALFEPGRYRIGVGLNSFPHKHYRNLDADGQVVALEVGKTTKVTFRVRRREATNGVDARNNQPERTITIRVVDQAGRPVEGAKVFRNHVYRPEGEKRTRIENETYWTDAEGNAVVALSGTSVDLRLWVRKQNFVPLHAMWAKQIQSDGDKIPAEFTFQLEPGTVIGGIVKNEAGEPIEGVKIEVEDRTTSILNTIPVDSAERPGIRPIRASWLAEDKDAVVTDADGRWQLGNAPSDETLEETLNVSDERTGREASLRHLQQIADQIRPLRLALRLSHSDYADDYKTGGLQQQQDITHQSLRDQTATIVMKRGNTLTGQVTDRDGNPIADATVLLRDADRFSSRDSDVVRANENGEYRFEHLAGPPRLLMVHAAGWPVEVKLAMANEPSKVDVRLRPGRKIAVQFLDGAGKLIPNVRVSIVEWNGRRMRELYYADALNGQIARRSDANGKFEWTAAPTDRLRCDFWKDGYQTIQSYTLTPADDVYVVTLMQSPDEND